MGAAQHKEQRQVEGIQPASMERKTFLHRDFGSIGRAVEPLEGCSTSFGGSIVRIWVLQCVISQHLLML